MQNGKIIGKNIGFGTEIDGIPHFIAKEKKIYKGKEEKIISPKPGFYIEDIETNQNYIGYLNNLNERDYLKNIENSREFNMVVRGVGNYLDKEGNRSLLLEERVKGGDRVHVQILEKVGYGEFCSKFLGYNVFIINSQLNLARWKYVFGRVKNVEENHRSFELLPISIINKRRFKEYKNRIL